MHISLPSRTNQASKAPWPGSVLLIAFLAILPVAAGGALVAFGPQMRADQEAQRGYAIEEENRTFCVKFGMGPETARYRECAAALNEIRALHEERTLRETSSIL